MFDPLVWLLCVLCFAAGWAARYLLVQEAKEFAPTTTLPPPSLVPPSIVEDPDEPMIANPRRHDRHFNPKPFQIGRADELDDNGEI